MNIFLVEDEHWALAELAALFQVYEPRHRIFSFDNGDDALAAAGSVRPHLVVTDINMPGIDGLELIEQLHRLDPAIKCVILSVHDQFEYARQGMKFGVNDYLLKPVKKDVLYQTVDAAIRQIESDSRQKEELTCWSIAQLLLSPDPPANELSREMNGRAYVLALFAFESLTVRRSPRDAVPARVIKRLLADRDGRAEELYAVDLDTEHRVVLFPQTGSLSVEEIHAALFGLHGRLQQPAVRLHARYALKPARTTLYDACLELKRGLEEGIVFGAPTFLAPGGEPAAPGFRGVWDKVRLLEAHFRKGDVLKGRNILTQLLEELRSMRATRKQLRLFVIDMLFSLKFNWLSARSGQADLNDLHDNDRELGGIHDYGELLEWLNEHIAGLYGIRGSKAINPKELVPVVIQWIHQNYNHNLSLQQFAAEHHVSLGYLSRIFKSRTGCTFSDYLANYRVKRAKELLKGGIDRVNEVSQLVGYEDPKHFSALFKRTVGESPLAYARRNAD